MAYEELNVKLTLVLPALTGRDEIVAMGTEAAQAITTLEASLAEVTAIADTSSAMLIQATKERDKAKGSFTTERAAYMALLADFDRLCARADKAERERDTLAEALRDRDRRLDRWEPKIVTVSASATQRLSLSTGQALGAPND